MRTKNVDEIDTCRFEDNSSEHSSIFDDNSLDDTSLSSNFNSFGPLLVEGFELELVCKKEMICFDNE